MTITCTCASPVRLTRRCTAVRAVVLAGNGKIRCRASRPRLPKYWLKSPGRIRMSPRSSRSRMRGFDPLPPGALILGDCLLELPKLARAHPDGFDLVYVDPPFNAGGVRSARRGRGMRANGERAYADAWGGLENFLAMLRPRLAAIRDAMSEQGSLWLHLDHRSVHDTKVLADQIFGVGR